MLFRSVSQSRYLLATLYLILVSHEPISNIRLLGVKCLVYKPSTGKWNLDIYKQVLFGLGHCDQNIVFLAEHDVLYPHDYYASCLKKIKFGYVNYAQNTYMLNALGYWTYRPSVFQSTCFGEKSKLIEATQFKINTIEGGENPKSFDIGAGDFQLREYFNTNPVLDIRHEYNATVTGTADKSQKIEHKIEYWGEAQFLISRLGLTKTHGIIHSEDGRKS